MMTSRISNQLLAKQIFKKLQVGHRQFDADPCVALEIFIPLNSLKKSPIEFEIYTDQTAVFCYIGWGWEYRAIKGMTVFSINSTYTWLTHADSDEFIYRTRQCNARFANANTNDGYEQIAVKQNDTEQEEFELECRKKFWDLRSSSLKT